MTLEPTGDADGTHRVRQAVAGIIGAESIVMVVYGFVLGIDTLVAKPTTSLAAAAFLAVLVVLLGAGVGAVALGVWRGQRWARSPGLVWQALQASLALPAVGLTLQVKAPLLVAAVIVAVGLFLPGVVDEPEDGRTPLDRD